jgi:hypothetical protein
MSIGLFDVGQRFTNPHSKCAALKSTPVLLDHQPHGLDKIFVVAGE